MLYFWRCRRWSPWCIEVRVDDTKRRLESRTKLLVEEWGEEVRPRPELSAARAAQPAICRGSSAAVLIARLQLLEGADLDLAHPLARDAVLLRQVLERRRLVLQPALDQDVRARARSDVFSALAQQASRRRPSSSRSASVVSWLSASSTSQSCHSPSPSCAHRRVQQWSGAASRRFMLTTSCSGTSSCVAILRHLLGRAGRPRRSPASGP